MKKHLLAAWFCLYAVASGAQFTTNDAALDKRLHAYMALNKALDFEKIMDYMHPSLFELAPREAILQSFEQIFKSEAMTLGFDSLQLVQASAPFVHGGVTYRKVDYFTRLHLKFNDTSVYAEEGFTDNVTASLEKAMAGKTITFDEKNRQFVVSGTDVLFAIKDAKAPDWMFLGFQDNPQMMARLYPKEVIAHFKLL